ncbi:MAG: metal ABC transporter ATP-binding protein [Hyphomicrobiaceae bacterium]
MLDRVPLADAARPLVRLGGAGFAAGTTEILKDVTLDLTPGEPIVLLGPNGSGKTTLLKIAMGLIAPTSGEVLADRAAVRSAFLFQKPVMLRRTAAANIAFALAAAGRPTDRGTIEHLLDRVGLAPLAERPARRLSGGEQQRLALARALAREPAILFLDEPTASLDPQAAKVVEDLIHQVVAEGVTVVMSTHDLGQARRIAGTVVFLVRGRLVEHAPATSFFSNPSTEAARRFLAGDLVL